MIKIKEMQSEGFYLIISRSTKKSSFFENKSQIRLFINQFNRHLSGMCELVDFIHLNVGYVYIIRTKSEGEIIAHYQKSRKMSKKTKVRQSHTEVWRMLSEHFRIVGATYVSMANRRDGSRGTKYHSTYERYLIESQEELKFISHMIKCEKVFIDQKQRRFRFKDRIVNRRLKTSNLLSSFRIKKEKLFKSCYKAIAIPGLLTQIKLKAERLIETRKRMRTKIDIYELLGIQYC